VQIFWQDAPKTEAAAPAEPAAAPATVNGDAESDPAKRKPKTSSVSVISVVVSDQVLASSRPLSLVVCLCSWRERDSHERVRCHATHLLQDEAAEFYCSKLGFEKVTDVTTPEYRWLTIKPPKQEGLELTLMKPATEDDKAVIGRQTGSIPFLVINTDDVQHEYERLKALGVEFTQPPTDRFYGIESLLRDPFGNIINLIQPKDH